MSATPTEDIKAFEFSITYRVLSFFITNDIKLQKFISVFQSVLLEILQANISETKQTSWPLVRNRNIPTKQPPLVDEI
jgi:hypothetical protein